MPKNEQISEIVTSENIEEFDVDLLRKLYESDRFKRETYTVVSSNEYDFRIVDVNTGGLIATDLPELSLRYTSYSDFMDILGVLGGKSVKSLAERNRFRMSLLREFEKEGYDKPAKEVEQKTYTNEELLVQLSDLRGKLFKVKLLNNGLTSQNDALSDQLKRNEKHIRRQDSKIEQFAIQSNLGKKKNSLKLPSMTYDTIGKKLPFGKMGPVFLYKKKMIQVLALEDKYIGVSIFPSGKIFRPGNMLLHEEVKPMLGLYDKSTSGSVEIVVLSEEELKGKLKRKSLVVKNIESSVTSKIQKKVETPTSPKKGTGFSGEIVSASKLMSGRDTRITPGRGVDNSSTVINSGNEAGLGTKSYVPASMIAGRPENKSFVHDRKIPTHEQEYTFTPSASEETTSKHEVPVGKKEYSFLKKMSPNDIVSFFSGQIENLVTSLSNKKDVDIAEKNRLVRGFIMNHVIRANMIRWQKEGVVSMKGYKGFLRKSKELAGENLLQLVRSIPFELESDGVDVEVDLLNHLDGSGLKASGLNKFKKSYEETYNIGINTVCSKIVEDDFVTVENLKPLKMILERMIYELDCIALSIRSNAMSRYIGRIRKYIRELTDEDNWNSSFARTIKNRPTDPAYNLKKLIDSTV